MCFNIGWMTLRATVVILVHSFILWSRGISQEVEKKVAAPGSDAVLSCLFPVKANMDFESLVINWQLGDTVVHSFYLGSDQLATQSKVYRGRTSLFHDQLQTGNASLMLTDIQPEYSGDYKCYVTCNNGQHEWKIQLLVAVPYDEPEIAVQYLCENILISLSSCGFPAPVVTWFAPLGYENTTLTPDSRGRYRLQSNRTLNLNSTATVSVEMSLDVLSQKFNRTVTLHPQTACCEEQSPRSRVGFCIAVVVVISSVIMLLFQRHQTYFSKV